MNKFKMLVYPAFLLAAALSLLSAAHGFLPFGAELAVYVCSAVLMVLAAVCVYQDIRAKIWKNLKRKIEMNELTNRVYKDYGYRILTTTLPSTAVNLAYTIYNSIIGILNRSPWFITLAFYYGLLCSMRLVAVRAKTSADRMENRKKAFETEYSVLKRDGILFLPMAVVLSGMIRLTISDHTISGSTEIAAITIAAYTFYKIIISAVNVVKVRKIKSPILKSIRNIGFADALVSLISLQNILILSFDSEKKRMFQGVMNAALGLAVCLIIAGMGIHMIRTAIEHENKG